jgi:hypothetical protein
MHSNVPQRYMYICRIYPCLVLLSDFANMPYYNLSHKGWIALLSSQVTINCLTVHNCCPKVAWKQKYYGTYPTPTPTPFSLQVTAVCQEAALHALQEDMSLHQVHARHFDLALVSVKPRITQELIAFYNTYARTSGLHSIWSTWDFSCLMCLNKFT